MLRLASAAVLLLLVVTTIWYLPFWATWVLAVVAAMLAAFELAGISAKLGADVPPAFLCLASGLIVVTFALDAGVLVNGPDHLLGIVLIALVVAAGTITLVSGPPGSSTLARAAVMVMGPLYIGLPLGAIAWIRWGVGGNAAMWLLAVIAVSDSMQYYTGRRIGRTKLAPAISPAKTREGALGGLFFAGIAGLLLGRVWLTTIDPYVLAGVAVVLALAGMAGDLFESMLKRSAGIKDSSALIPGHGGILDRIDAHLFAAPIYFLFLRLLL